MASKTQIANRALSKLGQPRVSNVETQDIKSARVINGMWDYVRDAMLQSYPWNFATKRAVLSPDVSTEVFGEWAYQYSVPSDYLAFHSIYSTNTWDLTYSVENNKIMTNIGDSLNLKYIAQITNTGSFTPMFNEALATRLAFEACEELVGNASKKNLLFQEWQLLLNEAMAQDAKEVPVRYGQQSTWVLARL
jgi:hypothetical protein